VEAFGARLGGEGLLACVFVGGGVGGMGVLEYGATGGSGQGLYEGVYVLIVELVCGSECVYIRSTCVDVCFQLGK